MLPLSLQLPSLSDSFSAAAAADEISKCNRRAMSSGLVPWGSWHPYPVLSASLIVLVRHSSILSFVSGTVLSSRLVVVRAAAGRVAMSIAVTGGVKYGFSMSAASASRNQALDS